MPNHRAMLADIHGEWLSAAAITSLFVVARETLELYHLRGTLESMVRPDGARMFDAVRVAKMFGLRRRERSTRAGDSSPPSSRSMRAANLGG